MTQVIAGEARAPGKESGGGPEMTENPVARYLDAIEALEQAAAEADRLAETVHDASVKLKNWREVNFVNVDAQGAAGRGGTIDAREWPSAEQLAGAVALWHARQTEVRAAWEAVPPNRRAGLQPPDHAAE
jgi:hypothetical protein